MLTLRGSLAALLLALAAAPPAGARPFRRALVYPGGTGETAELLGMLAGAREAGWHPDVVVGSCGGSSAALIANALPQSATQKRYLESKGYFDHLWETGVDPELGHGNGLKSRGAWVLGAGEVWGRLPALRRIPSISMRPILLDPQETRGQFLNQPFRVRTPRAVVTAARALFSPQLEGKPLTGRPLFQEVFFTDPDTATALARFSSPAGGGSNGVVAEAAATVTGASLAAANRASVADPYYIAPYTLWGQRFLTGAIDIEPIEAAHALADEVMAVRIPPVTRTASAAIRFTFGFDLNDRISRLSASPDVDYWIDLTDEKPFAERYGFGYVDRWEREPSPTHLVFAAEPAFSPVEVQVERDELYLRSKTPATYGGEFVSRVRAQWERGRQRAREALRGARQSQAHVRIPRQEPRL